MRGIELLWLGHKCTAVFAGWEHALVYHHRHDFSANLCRLRLKASGQLPTFGVHCRRKRSSLYFDSSFRVAQAKAERIISEELRQLGWQEADLAARRKRDPGKLAIAVRLRKQT